MRRTFSWRLVKLLTVSVVLALSAYILVSTVRVTPSKHPPKLSPLPEEEYRLISPKTYQYNLSQPAVCKDTTPFLFFMDPVAPVEAAARETIKKTWGQDTRTLFYFGLPEGGRCQAFRPS